MEQFLTLEDTAREMCDKHEHNEDLQGELAKKQQIVEDAQAEIKKLTDPFKMDIEELDIKQAMILDELQTRYVGDKQIPTAKGKVQFKVTKTTVIKEPHNVAAILLKNDKGDCIKSFDMKTVRAFIEADLMGGAAVFEEKINVSVQPP